jgi:DNA-binding response OmpR family regulator
MLTHVTLNDKGVWLDEAAAVVWMEGRSITNLTRLEFELLRMLYRRLGQVCSRDEILADLYPDEVLDPQVGSSDNRVDSLVRHLRKAIEPDGDHPHYLLTVRGRGYKLVETAAALPK